MFRSGSEVVDHASPDDNDDNLTPCVAVQHKRQHFDTKASSRKVTAVACLACQRRKSKVSLDSDKDHPLSKCDA